MIATTTLNKIRDNQPCGKGWLKLLKHLGKTTADDQTITLKTILDSNGFGDALWCLRASDASEFEMRKFARLCAQDVLHLWDAPEIVKRYLETGDENIRENARAAANTAAWAAACAAWGAARDAAWAAAWAAACAAWGAARDAADAWDAADATWGAARDAADATWGAAWDATRGDQTARFISMFCED